MQMPTIENRWTTGNILTLVMLVVQILVFGASGIYFTQASPGSAYGAAGSVVALLVWVNFSSQLALFGAEFTHVWAYTYGSRAR